MLPPISLQLLLPCTDGCNNGSVVQIVVSRPPKSNSPEAPNVSFTCKNVILLQVVRPPLSFVPPSPPCPGWLSVWLSRNKLPRLVNNVDVVKEINDEHFLFIPGVSEIDTQVPQDNWGATRWASFPGRLEILHPHHVRGGNIYTHAVKLCIASDKLECEEIRRNNTRLFHPISPMILLPQQSNASLIVAHCLRSKNLVPWCEGRVMIIRYHCLHQNG